MMIEENLVVTQMVIIPNHAPATILTAPPAVLSGGYRDGRLGPEMRRHTRRAFEETQDL
jgi:hypothetical protein